MSGLILIRCPLNPTTGDPTCDSGLFHLSLYRDYVISPFKGNIRSKLNTREHMKTFENLSLKFRPSLIDIRSRVTTKS